GWWCQRHERALAVAADLDAGRKRSQVRALAAHDQRAEMVVAGGWRIQRDRWRVRPVVLPRLERGLVPRRNERRKALARGSVGVRIALLAHLADPSHPCVAVEVRMAAVDERRERAALE